MRRLAVLLASEVSGCDTKFWFFEPATSGRFGGGLSPYQGAFLPYRPRTLAFRFGPAHRPSRSVAEAAVHRACPRRGNGKGGDQIPCCRRLIRSRCTLPFVAQLPGSFPLLNLAHRQLVVSIARHLVRPKAHHQRTI